MGALLDRELSSGPELIAAAAEKKRPGVGCSVDAAGAVLDDVFAALQPDVTAAYVNRTQEAFRRHKIGEATLQAGTKAAIDYVSTVTSRDARLAAYPGKPTFGRVVEELRTRFGIHIRISDLIDQLSPSTADAELMPGARPVSDCRIRVTGAIA